MSQTAKPRRVYFALYEGVQLLDVAGPAEVLSEANRDCGRPVYDIRYVSRSRSGMVVSSAGLGLATQRLPRTLDAIHTLVVPGADLPALQQALSDRAFMRWLATASGKAKRIASICSGAVLLGRLGLLDGRRVTSHWRALELLQDENPECRVERDTLFVEDGDLWTSAGVLSGVDMALAIVARDVGASVALRIARNIIVYLIRDGGQSQFSGPIDFQTKAQRSELLGLVAWLEEHLSERVTVEQMAERMATSVRTLHRRCLEVFDMTPAHVLSELRLERSRNLLHQPSASVKAIAHECGFSDASSYSKAFQRRYGVPPAHYRKSFRVRA